MLENNNGFHHIYKGLFPQPLDDEKEELKRIHTFATIHYIYLIIYALTIEEREMVINMIDDKNRNDFVKFYNIFNKNIKGE